MNHHHSHTISLKPQPPAPPATVPQQVYQREPQRPPKKTTFGKKALWAVLVVVLAVSAFKYNTITSWFSPAPTPDPQRDKIEKEANDIVAEVGKLIDLPRGEVPTVATVSDPEKLRSQAFFANAKSGDKVLLYTKARKAYLYRPQEHRLIEVGPITTNPETTL